MNLHIRLHVVQQQVLQKGLLVFFRHLLAGDAQLNAHDEHDAGILQRRLHRTARGQAALGKQQVPELLAVVGHGVAVAAGQQLSPGLFRLHVRQAFGQRAVRGRKLQAFKIGVPEGAGHPHKGAEGFENLRHAAVVDGQSHELPVNGLGRAGLARQHRGRKLGIIIRFRHAHQRQAQFVRQCPRLRRDAAQIAVFQYAQPGCADFFQGAQKLRQRDRLPLQHIAGGQHQLAALQPLCAVRGVHRRHGRNLPARAVRACQKAQAGQAGQRQIFRNRHIRPLSQNRFCKCGRPHCRFATRRGRRDFPSPRLVPVYQLCRRGAPAFCGQGRGAQKMRCPQKGAAHFKHFLQLFYSISRTPGTGSWRSAHPAHRAGCRG